MSKLSGPQMITMRAYDVYYYAGSVSRDVIIGSGNFPTSTGSISTGTITTEFTTPVSTGSVVKESGLSLTLSNPTSGKSSIFNDQYVNLRWKANVNKEIVSNVYIDGKLSKILS